MRILKYLIVLSSFFVFTNSWATQVLVWNKKPLELRLEVGKERIVEFEDNIILGFPQKVKSRMRISSAAGVAYLTPVTPFPKTRVQIKLASSNEVIFVDMFAVDSEDSQPLESVKVISNEEQQENEANEQALFESTDGVTLKQLVQYATHAYFAPPRLRDSSLAIRISDVTKPVDLRLLFQGSSAGLYELKPLKNFQTTEYNLTTILLTNRTQHQQKIIYSDITGEYETVSSQHLTVGPKASATQSTVLYLVTKQPLSENGLYSY